MKWHMALIAATIGMLCGSCGERSPGAGVRADSERHPAKTARHDSSVRNIAMPSGTILKVQIDDALSTATNNVGDEFSGTLIEPVLMNGEEVLPAQTRLKGHVTVSVKPKHSKERAILGITLDCYELRGSQHPVMTSLEIQSNDAYKRLNLELIDGGSGLGVVNGAGTGNVKSAATANSTQKKNVNIAAKTVFGFVLRVPAPL